MQIKELREVSLSIGCPQPCLCPHLLPEFKWYKLLNAVAESICVMFDAPVAYGYVALCLIEKWGNCHRASCSGYS